MHLGSMNKLNWIEKNLTLEEKEVKAAFLGQLRLTWKLSRNKKSNHQFKLSLSESPINMVQGVSGIRASFTWLWWLGFRLEPILATAPKNDAHFKNGQLKNNHLDMLV